MRTRIAISALIGFFISYLILVKTHNSWDFITGLEPNECVSKIGAFIFFSVLIGAISLFISILFE